MSGTFECPSCGAPLHVEDTTSAVISCQYCGKTIIVPEELRGEQDFSAGQSAGPELNLDGLIGNAQEFGEIAELVLTGNKIKAIMRYHQLTGLGLKESREAIEQVERGEPLTITSVTISPGEHGEDPEWVDVMQQARAYLLGGSKIKAIKVYHEAFNAGLKESKDVIDALEESLRSSGDLGRELNADATRKRPNPIIYSYLAVLIVGAVLCAVLSSAFGLFSALAPLAAMFGINQIQDIQQATQEVSFIPLQLEPSPTPGFARETFAFGGEGTGPGLFTDARSIAVDRSSGKIYVAEYQGGRVQAFDPSGRFLTQWIAGGRDVIINGLAAGRDGVVYVSAAGKGYAYEGATGALIQEIPLGEGFNYLESLSLTASGELVAVEGGENLLWFDQNLQIVRSLPAAISEVSGDSELDASVGVDGIGDLFVLGTFNNSVFHFNAEGKFINRFGSDGDAPGQFRAPSAIAVDNQSRVYVSDINGIQVFAPDGRYLDLIEVRGVAFGMAFNDQNELFVMSNNEQVIRFEIQ